MARDNHVRLSDEELQLLDDAAEEMFGAETAQEVSRGLTIGKMASRVLEGDE